MSASPRFVFVSILFALLLASGATLAAGPPAPVPTQALMLLPENPVAVLYLSSLDQCEQTLNSVTGELKKADSSLKSDVLDYFPEGLSRIKDLIDRTKPMVLVATLDLSYGAPEPQVTLLIPVNDPEVDAETLAMASGFASAETGGGYLALSAIQNYTASGEVPAFLDGISSAQLVGRIDLETVFAITRPMIEMMMQSMQQKSANAPSANQPPPEVFGLATALMNSARSLELTLGEDGGSLECSLALDINARSVLDAGPQPALDEALQLTKYLPDYGDLLGISATNLSLLYKNVPFLEELGDSKLASNLPKDEREPASAWLQTARRKWRSLQEVSATTARIHQGTIQWVQVAKVEDAGAALGDLDALLMSLPEADLGLRLERLEDAASSADRMTRHDYEWRFDPARLEKVLADSNATAQPPQDVQTTVAFLEKFLPRLHLAARGDRLLFCLMNDEQELDSVLQRFGGEGDTQPAALESLQSWAGAGVQVMSRIELRSLTRELLRFYSQLEGEGAAAIQAGPPVEIRYAGMVGGARHSMRLRANTKALMQLMAELQEAKVARGGE